MSMRTNIVIDDALLAEAFKYTDSTTKKDVIHLALQELVDNHKKLSLLDLRGSILLSDEYDYKKMRNNACT